MISWPQLARQLSGGMAAVCLAGCAALQGSEPPASTPAEAPPATAAVAATPPEAAASAPSTVSYRVEVQAPEALHKLLTTYLDLARFQNAPQADGITDAELIRLAAASPAQARSLLETEGYFNPQVRVTRTDPPGETPLITLAVTPGPRTTVTGWELSATGDLQKRIDAGDKDAQALMARLQQRWPLKDGKPFSQPEWSSAKNGTVALLRADGYPTASANGTAHIDAKTNEATLVLQLDSGPLFLLGELRIEGLKRYSEASIRNLADFSPGTPYSEKRLFDYQERLGKLGLFESVAVEIDPAPADTSAAPVIVRVRELLLQQAVAGVGFSDNTRERFTLEHKHRRPFGVNVLMSNKFEIGRYQRTWDGSLLGDPGAGQYRPLLAGGSSWLKTDDDLTTSWHTRLGRTLYTERIERLIYGEYLRATVRNAAGESTNQAVTANYNWIWRDVDSIILPTRGLTSVIQAAGGYSRSNDKDNGFFTRLYTRNTLYWPLGKSWFTQSRLEYGQVFANENIGIPDTLLYRAGGDDSVRGYGYREIAPRKDVVLADGTTKNVLTSARKLVTASVELAHPFSANRPAFWWATFLDAGSAADQWSEFKPSLGYGLGVRWRSPVGPLRVDWAYGRDVHKGRLHFSVGIAF